MVFPDNQTKHFYALKSSDTATVKQVGDNLRVIFKDSNSNAIGTTDTINTRHILSAKITEVLPTYFRKWTVSALSASAVAADTTYYVYFYLENMLGFGVQDRFDRVASYTAKTGDTVATVMAALKADLENKLNAGPVKGDFTVTLSTNDIVVTENKNSKTYKFNELDMRMNSTPYVYNVTMSTGKTTGGAIEAWTSAQKEIKATNTSDVYITAADKVRAMELYFLRNRGDLYDLNPDFKTAILNEANIEYNTAHYYYTLDVHYAFSDELGYTYYSEKDLTVAMNNSSHAAPSKLTTLLASLKPITDRVTALENA